MHACMYVCVCLLHVRNKTESGWGPNAVFRFPQEGGTGGIWTKVAALLPKDKQKYNMTVTNLDPVNKIVSFENGTTIKYNKVREACMYHYYHYYYCHYHHY